MIKLSFVFLGISLMCFSCNFKRNVEHEQDIFNYFGQFEYDRVDTLIKLDEISELTFYFFKGENHEKIYVKKDTIKHLFGSFSENKTFWAEEWITYTSNGQIVEEESQYVFVKELVDSTQFHFMSKPRSYFKIKTFEINNENKGSLVKTYSLDSNFITVANEELEGFIVEACYLEDRKNDGSLDLDIAYETIEMNININRASKNQQIAHLELINKTNQ